MPDDRMIAATGPRIAAQTELPTELSTELPFVTFSPASASADNFALLATWAATEAGTATSEVSVDTSEHPTAIRQNLERTHRDH